MIPWSPLARGRLTRGRDTATARAETDEGGKILYRDEDQAVAERVHEIAGKRGLSPAQVALAWVMRNPAVTSPVVGVTKPAQLADAVAAVDSNSTKTRPPTWRSPTSRTRPPTWRSPSTSRTLWRAPGSPGYRKSCSGPVVTGLLPGCNLPATARFYHGELIA